MNSGIFSAATHRVTSFLLLAGLLVPMAALTACWDAPSGSKLWRTLEINQVMMVSGLEGGGDDPYFGGFAWHSTFGKPNSTTKVIKTGGDNFKVVASNVKDSDWVLVPEDIGMLRYPSDGPWDSLEKAQANPVTIAGLTVCGFEADSQGGASAHNAALTLAADKWQGALDLLTNQPFSPSVVSSIGQNMTDFLDDFSVPDPNPKALVNKANDESEHKVASAIFSGIKEAAQLIPGIIRHFKKDRPPDPDDFVGCVTIMKVDLTETYFKTLEAGLDCGSSENHTDVALCWANAELPSLQFNNSEQKEPNRRWYGGADSSSQFTRHPTLGDVDAPGPDMTVDAPFGDNIAALGFADGQPHLGKKLVAPRISLPNGAKFAAFVSVQGFEQNSSSQTAYSVAPLADGRDNDGGEFEIKLHGGNSHTNVRFKAQSIALPRYVDVKRALANHSGTFDVEVPADATRYAVISEQLVNTSNSQTNPSKIIWSVGATFVDSSGRRKRRITYHAGDALYRLTVLQWPGSEKFGVEYSTLQTSNGQPFPWELELGQDFFDETGPESTIDVDRPSGPAEIVFTSPVEFRPTVCQAYNCPSRSGKLSFHTRLDGENRVWLTSQNDPNPGAFVRIGVWRFTIGDY